VGPSGMTEAGGQAIMNQNCTGCYSRRATRMTLLTLGEAAMLAKGMVMMTIFAHGFCWVTPP
jgi:hypothetical protein